MNHSHNRASLSHCYDSPRRRKGSKLKRSKLTTANENGLQTHATLDTSSAFAPTVLAQGPAESFQTLSPAERKSAHLHTALERGIFPRAKSSAKLQPASRSPKDFGLASIFQGAPSLRTSVSKVRLTRLAPGIYCRQLLLRQDMEKLRGLRPDADPSSSCCAARLLAFATAYRKEAARTIYNTQPRWR